MSPDELLRQLREAFARKDDACIAELCDQHSADIVENFESWLRVPQQILRDNAAVQAWIQPLALIARLFEAAGYPQLAERIFGRADNPLERWASSMTIAEQLVEAADYGEAASVIRAILPELEEASGTGVDDLRPKAYALLAKALFENGEQVEAKHFMQQALQDCRRVGDQDGVRIYTSNLRVIDAAVALSSDDESSELVLAIRAAVARAQERSDEAEFEESNAILTAALEDEEAAASAATYHGKIWGLMGLNFYRLEDFAQSRRYTQMALESCQRAEDADGVRIYSANLEHIGLKEGPR